MTRGVVNVPRRRKHVHPSCLTATPTGHSRTSGSAVACGPPHVRRPLQLPRLGPASASRPGASCPGASTGHADDLRPPKIRSTKEAFGGHWQRLDFDTPAITWLTCWPQPAHVALPHLRQVTCRHIGRSSSRVDRTKSRLYPPGFTDLSLRQRPPRSCPTKSLGRCAPPIPARGVSLTASDLQPSCRLGIPSAKVALASKPSLPSPGGGCPLGLSRVRRMPRRCRTSGSRRAGSGRRGRRSGAAPRSRRRWSRRRQRSGRMAWWSP